MLKRLLAPSRKLNNQTLINNPKEKDFNGQALVTLSYDDGLNNNYDIALPLHEQYGIPCTFNVIGERTKVRTFWNNFFDWYRVRDCQVRGAEIASHSFYHRSNLTTLTDEELHNDFSKAEKILNAVARDVETFAVPFSKYNESVKAIAKQYYKGIRVHGDLLNNIPPTNRYELNSAIAVTNETTFEDVKAVIDQAISENKWAIIMLHGINDAPQTERDYYEITPQLLEETLQYINSFDRNTLLPINTKDALKFTLGEQY